MGQLRVIRPQDRVPDAASGAMLRETAVSGRTTGAERLWVGYARLGPGAISAVHHHGESESAIYMLSGQARFYSGDKLDQVQDADAGDFIFVPPHIVHLEMNRSADEPVLMVVARSTQDAIVVNVQAPPGWKVP